MRNILFSTDLTPLGYQHLLSKFCHAYAELERSISQIPEMKAILKRRSKVHLLRKDLNYVKSITGINSVNGFEPHSLAADNYAHALGMLYVMEGATLGGKFIVKHLLEVNWVTLEGCLNFFNSYGSRRGEMWKQFTKIVENYSNQYPDQDHYIVKGARSAFVHMDKLF